MSIREKLEDVYEEVDQAERSISRALRLMESHDLDDVADVVYTRLKRLYHDLRRLKIEISDEIEGVYE